MRRSLIAPSLLLLLMLGLSVLPGSSNFWTVLALATLGLPLIINFLEQVIRRMKYDRVKRYTPGFFGLKSSLFQFLLTVVFLPYQAVRTLDAIFVTLFRVCVSRKHMLEWVTSADVEKSQDGSLKSYLASMSQSIALAVVLFLLANNFSRKGLFTGLVLFAAWIAAPFLAYHISREDDHDEERLAADDLVELRKVTRRTWRYFEEFQTRRIIIWYRTTFRRIRPEGSHTEPLQQISAWGSWHVLTGRDMGYIGIKETVDSICQNGNNHREDGKMERPSV